MNKNGHVSYPEQAAYAEKLLAAGLPEREAARAYFYVVEYGMEALSTKDNRCVTFTTPTCGDWNCMNPDHQVLQLGNAPEGAQP